MTAIEIREPGGPEVWWIPVRDRLEVELAEEPPLDEEVEGVVDGGPGDHGEAGLDARPNPVGGGVLVGEEDVLGDDDALRRRLDAAGGEQFDDVSLHDGGILRLDLDDVKRWTCT